MDRLISEEKVLDIIFCTMEKNDPDSYKAIRRMIKAIPSAEPKTEQFVKWVATEIFDDMWEYNKDAFAEIACRKLEKLGIVRAKGDEWELVEPQERSDKK